MRSLFARDCVVGPGGLELGTSLHASPHIKWQKELDFSRKWSVSVAATYGPLGPTWIRTLSLWRSTRISASSEVRDRKNPISPHQISLQSSFIEQKIQPIRCLEPIVLSLRQGHPSLCR